MPRRPNYNFERNQRDRDKQAKREAKRAARAARKAGLPEGELLPAEEAPPERTGTVDLKPRDPDPAEQVPAAD
jgi:hypothetical protein